MNNLHNIDEFNIHIDHLVFEGIVLTRYQQQQLKDSLETELVQLIYVHGIPRNVKNTPICISGNAIHLQSYRSEPAQLGKQIAASLYSSLDGGSKGT